MGGNLIFLFVCLSTYARALRCVIVWYIWLWYFLVVYITKLKTMLMACLSLSFGFLDV